MQGKDWIDIEDQVPPQKKVCLFINTSEAYLSGSFLGQMLEGDKFWDYSSCVYRHVTHWQLLIHPVEGL